MISFRSVGSGSVPVAFLVMVVLWLGLQSNCLKSPSVGELARTVGGACYRTAWNNYCKESKPCSPTGSGTWYKRVGQGIEQEFCYDLELFGTPGNGRRGCTTIDYQDCVKFWQCTDSACTNCGPASTERKPTDLAVSGDN